MPNKGQGISIRRQRNFGGVHVVGASVKRDGIFKKQTLLSKPCSTQGPADNLMARTILRGVTNSEEKGNRKMVMEKIFITYIQDMCSGSRA
jgi:hypothetical protein